MHYRVIISAKKYHDLTTVAKSLFNAMLLHPSIHHSLRPCHTEFLVSVIFLKTKLLMMRKMK